MSDAPTPETDAEHMRILNDMEIPIESECFAMVTFARRLERERDEWKTKAILHGNAALDLEEEWDEWKRAHDHTANELNSLQEHCDESARIIERLERERDEARRELKLEQSRVWAAMLIIQKSDDERDSLRARVAELEADYKELARHHNMECTCAEIY